MTRTVFGAGILAAALLTGGCATKKYVRETTAPIQAKVDQVGEQTQKHGQAIQQTQAELKQVDERAQSGISAAKEQAMTAQNRANDAMNKANQASDLASKASDVANRDSQELTTLRQVVSNLDDYKQVADLTIPFSFNKYTLSSKDKEDLDNMVASASKNKRYFIAVEGYTDRTGSREYNEALSRRRANAVVEYLVAKHEVPIFRIHMIGLGEEKLVDTGRTRAARAKNRRVEVKVFSADASYSAAQAQGQPQSQTQGQPQLSSQAQ
jgi:outer membrane protein OmpA-like peptidoglycan-associated protein